MPIKIKVDINIEKKLRGAASKSSREIKNKVPALIVNSYYSKGISPVKGFGKYKPYRESVSKKKGRSTPVTLRDTGEFHDSLTAIQRANNSISLLFLGARNSRLASYFQFGTDHMDARPVLPTKGQSFKKAIIDRIKKIVNASIKELK